MEFTNPGSAVHWSGRPAGGSITFDVYCLVHNVHLQLAVNAKAVTALCRQGHNVASWNFYVPIIQAWTLCWMQLAPQYMLLIPYIDTAWLVCVAQQ